MTAGPRGVTIAIGLSHDLLAEPQKGRTMLSLLLLYYLIAFAIYALFLKLGVRWAQIPGVGWGRVLAASVIVWVVSAGAILLVRAGAALLGREGSGSEVVGLVLAVTATLMALKAVLRTDRRRTLQVWMATLAGSIAIVVLVLFVVNPYVVVAFVTPSNGMAPSLLGIHHVAVCPRCGGPAYLAPDPFPLHGVRQSGQAICGRCLQVSEITNIPTALGPPDRFLVDRLSSPHRWDIITFDYPEDRSVTYLQRLVGLPGERVSIKDGAVWINGQRQQPPPPIERIVYYPRPGLSASEVEGEDSGTVWTLAADEYFVLGDFSLRSKDSRAWTQGAPDHPPYALPRSYITGVATYIYWPPSRWRRLR